MKINKKKVIDKIGKLLDNNPKLESKVINLALQKIDSGDYVLERNFVFTADRKRLVYILGDDVTVKIPEGTEVIGEMAATGKKLMKVLSLPNTLHKIKKDAFSDCDSLTEVTIPASVDHVEAYAFSDCDSLKSVYFESVPKELSHKAFTDCSKLSNVSVPAEGVKVIRKALHMIDGDIDYIVVGRQEDALSQRGKGENQTSAKKAEE